MSEVKAMTFSDLKAIVEQLEKNSNVSEETKIFIDTGWDSVQEVEPESILLEEVAAFEVEDVLTKEIFSGYSLLEKAEKMNATGAKEYAIIIRNLY